MKVNKNKDYGTYMKKNLGLLFSLTYALFGIAWVLITDEIAVSLSSNPRIFINLTIAKGWFFILISSIAIYLITNIFIKDVIHSESELRKQRGELQIIFDSVPALIWYKDKYNRILRINKVAADLTGLDVKDIANRPAEEIYIEEASKYYQDDLEVINTGKPKTGIIETITAVGGKKIWVRTDKVPYYNESGEIIGVIVFSFEITEQVLAEEKLKQNSKQQEALLNTIPAYVYFKDLNSRYVAVNKALSNSIGLSAESFIGKTDFDLYPREHAEKFVRDDKEVIATGKPKYNIVLETISNDNLSSWSKTAKSPFYNSSGQIEGIVGITTDITEQIQTEQELKKNIQENKKLIDEVVEYDRIKTAFFANMSHEFKTPLNVILSTLQLITSYQLECSAGSCVTKIKKYGNIMKQNCYRLLRLINNLMDTTRIDSGNINFNPNNHNIVSIVEDTAMSVADYIENHGIKLEFDTDIEERIIACDADKIERIMLNLLSNAVKFTKPGGNIWVNIRDENENIIISVKDSGIGIPPDKLNTIFERFSQVNVSLTRDHEGSGIGLFLVRSLVEMHGGTIHVESNLGEGSEFIITLPVNILDEDKIIKNKGQLLQNTKFELADIEFADIQGMK